MKDYLMIIDKINEKFERFKLLVLQETKEVEELEKFSLTPQQEIIMLYIIRYEPAIANDIAKHLEISKSAISQVLHKLEDDKMIYRQVNPSNRRESLIYLGDRGKAYYQVLTRIDQLLVEKYYSKVSLEELNSVHDILTKIVGTTKTDMGDEK